MRIWSTIDLVWFVWFKYKHTHTHLPISSMFHNIDKKGRSFCYVVVEVFFLFSSLSLFWNIHFWFKLKGKNFFHQFRQKFLVVSFAIFDLFSHVMMERDYFLRIHNCACVCLWLLLLLQISNFVILQNLFFFLLHSILYSNIIIFYEYHIGKKKIRNFFYRCLTRKKTKYRYKTKTKKEKIWIDFFLRGFFN